MYFRDDTAIHTAYEDYETLDSAMPERNLMRALLKTALDDIRKSGDVYRDARAWLLSSEEEYLYSYVSVCRHLNMCPVTILRVCGLDPREATDRRRIAA